MVTSRILFLLTYDTNLDFEAMIKKHALGDNVNYVCPTAQFDFHQSYLLAHSNLIAMQSNSQNQIDSLCHRWMNWL